MTKRDAAFFRRHAVRFLIAGDVFVWNIWRNGDQRGKVLMMYHYALSEEASCTECHDLQFDVRRLPEQCRAGLAIESPFGHTAFDLPPGSQGAWMRHIYHYQRQAHALAMLFFLARGGFLPAEAKRQWEVVRAENAADRARSKAAAANFEDDMPF